ncbi:ATP-dependent RNA helicase Prh1 [Coprinopsis sp. MPI-PUGE-AT-0042]|nr:ATP-dependent RNA helicase Prh1 [Coprinopsis sp. MPI-PUGE-AT-0042]
MSKPKIQLLRDKSFKKQHMKPSKPMPWVDVSDEEPPKHNLKRNGALLNGDSSVGHKRKKARHSYNPGGPNQNGSSSGSSTAFSVIQEQRAQLPIAQGREALVEEIRNNDVTVLLGETGSGKTTQIPQYILEAGLAGGGGIAITQPRRVAATSLAARVALEQKSHLGELVGYSVRFDEKYGPNTRIKYMTDGMIVRELLSDPLLSKYSVIVVDEAHERTLRTDLLIANLKKILKERNGPIAHNDKGKKQSNPLKVIIMSATLDAEKFSRFFSNAKVLYVQGRQHPVTNYYSAENQLDYVDSAMRTFFQIHLDRPPGDVLIFLPGQEDIESLQASIDLFAKRLPADAPAVRTCAMYAAQDHKKNGLVFAPAPANTRKCILATNIAETSITIPGVTYVIDTGKAKEKQFLARSAGGGFDTLLTRDITKSSAMQRSGRAGREGKGYCFRLYTEDAFNGMAQTAQPEILRCSLTSSMLQLKCLDQNLEDLELMDAPDDDSIMSSLKTLWLLGAMDNEGKLTPSGRQMAAFPLEPQYACAVVASKNYSCTSEVLDIVSVISASSKLFVDVTEHRDAATEVRRKFKHATGDHMTILNIVHAYREVTASAVVSGPGAGGNKERAAKREWCRKHFLNERALQEAKDIREQLQQVCSRVGIDASVSSTSEDPILRSLGHGLAGNAAFLQPDSTYKQTMGPSTVKIHPSSSMCDKKVPAIIYDELVYTNQIYARGVSYIPKGFFAGLDVFRQRKA